MGGQGRLREEKYKEEGLNLEEETRGIVREVLR